MYLNHACRLMMFPSLFCYCNGPTDYLCFTIHSIPLASATDDDEEWGWEDSSAGGGDVELMGSFSSARVKDDDALNEALAIEKKQPAPKFVMSPPPMRSNIAGGGAGGNRKASSSPRVTARPAAAPPPASSPPPVHHASAPPPMAMQITSLGQKITNNNGSKKPPARAVKKNDDDLFASMGLSSKPTFAPKQPAGILGSKQSMMSSTSSSTSSWRNASVEADEAAKWDDDGDLDDLLND